MTATSDDIERIQAATTALQSAASAMKEIAAVTQNCVTSIQEYAQAARPVYEEFYQRLLLKSAFNGNIPKK